jgi:hypothetical protein
LKTRSEKELTELKAFTKRELTELKALTERLSNVVNQLAVPDAAKSEVTL